ncbi:radical SAM protein [Bianquea renquensis]|uniref:Radical SAM protein n=1 Tax=Bianquea renquensis TaxID=2763661 RepID=A0A926DRX8_9FIRM|nr:radical SAM protein [Bianquea renquensis]MBC8542189.1 radical SAM protein [Bianquea renquensis]
MGLSELRHCRLCPRQCGADRLAGKAGFCGATGETVRVARVAPHMWEEPVLSGEKGSGTIFFSSCSLRCVFCQNIQISREAVGENLSIEQLGDCMLELQAQGVHNINFVTPGHYILHIREALQKIRGRDLTIPVVYNSSGYERPESLSLLKGLIDIYLPDFKYMSPALSERYSNARDYSQVAKTAIAAMVDQVGAPVLSREGYMVRGVMVRHLALPGQEIDSKRILKYLYESYGDEIYISLMSQYTPMSQVASKFPELNRKLSRRQYARLVEYALTLGFDNGFIQEGDAAQESFIPPFM